MMIVLYYNIMLGLYKYIFYGNMTFLRNNRREHTFQKIIFKNSKKIKECY